MRTLVLTLTVALMSMNAYAKGLCVDPGLQWTIDTLYVDGTVAAIQGDGAPYVNGQAGVDTVVNVCSGTFDATLNLSPGRSFSMDFSQILATNAYTPAWALAGATETGAGFLNVHHLWFVPPGLTRLDEYTFTTWMTGVVPTAKGAQLFMINPSHDTAPPNPISVNADYNSPYPSARVIVHHCPANTNTPTCPTITTETWFVYPEQASTIAGDPAPVGMLGTTVKGTAGINSGQFRMPFSFTIGLLN